MAQLSAGSPVLANGSNLIVGHRRPFRSPSVAPDRYATCPDLTTRPIHEQVSISSFLCAHRDECSVPRRVPAHSLCGTSYTSTAIPILRHFFHLPPLLGRCSHPLSHRIFLSRTNRLVTDVCARGITTRGQRMACCIFYVGLVPLGSPPRISRGKAPSKEISFCLTAPRFFLVCFCLDFHLCCADPYNVSVTILKCRRPSVGAHRITSG